MRPIVCKRCGAGLMEMAAHMRMSTYRNAIAWRFATDLYGCLDGAFTHEFDLENTFGNSFRLKLRRRWKRHVACWQLAVGKLVLAGRRDNGLARQLLSLALHRTSHLAGQVLLSELSREELPAPLRRLLRALEKKQFFEAAMIALEQHIDLYYDLEEHPVR